MSFTGNAKSDDWISQQINTGKFGYNTKSGTIVKLDTPMTGLSEEDQFMGTEAYGRGAYGSGLVSAEQEEYIKTLPKNQQSLINDVNKNKRKDQVVESMHELVKNPAFYAPGLIAAGAVLGPTVATAAEATFATLAPTIGGALTAPLTLPGIGAVPAVTAGNLINAGFATDFLVNRAPAIPGQIQRGDYGEAALNTGMGALDLMGVNAFTPLKVGERMSNFMKAVNKTSNTPASLPGGANVVSSVDDVGKGFKINNENFYRSIDLDDAVNSGVIRSKQSGEYAKSNPYFVEGKDFDKLSSTGSGASGSKPKYIFETPMVDETGTSLRAYPTNATAEYSPYIANKSSIPISEGKIYKLNNKGEYELFNPTSSVDDIVKQLPGSPNNFKSSIDWSKWNKEIPDNKVLMQEYDAIEQAAKADGTWMKNADGSEFKGVPEQFIQQNSSNFKNAFPDLVKDENNNFIKLYHGSNSKFDTFDATKFGSNTDDGFKGVGIYTTPLKKYSKSYGDNTYELAVNSKNKLKASDVFKEVGMDINKIPPDQRAVMINPDLKYFHREVSDKFKSRVNQYLDKDLLVADEAYPNMLSKSHEVVIPFNNRTKSLLNNNGMFDMTNPNIYKSVAGAIGAGTLSQYGPTQEDGEYQHGGSIPQAQTGNGEYKVKLDDTFYGIANRNNVSKEELLKLNPGIKIHDLKIDQSINLPKIGFDWGGYFSGEQGLIPDYDGVPTRQMFDEQPDQPEVKIPIETKKYNLGSLDNLDPHNEAFSEHILLREGRKPKSYYDTEEKMTGGIGHLLTPEEIIKYPENTIIPDEQTDAWFKADQKKSFKAALSQAKKLKIYNPDFVNALASVNFQLGPSWYKKHVETWRLLEEGNYDEATTEAANSIWNEQTPVRVADFQEAIKKLQHGGFIDQPINPYTLQSDNTRVVNHTMNPNVNTDNISFEANTVVPNNNLDAEAYTIPEVDSLSIDNTLIDSSIFNTIASNLNTPDTLTGNDFNEFLEAERIADEHRKRQEEDLEKEYKDPTLQGDFTINANFYADGWKNMEGASEEEVVDLQNVLLQKGYDIGSTGSDGDYGNKTYMAHRAMVDDGNLDPNSISRYYKKYNGDNKQEVAGIQQKLVDEGYMSDLLFNGHGSSIDGKFGDQTREALDLYNTSNIKEDPNVTVFDNIPSRLEETRCAAGMCTILEGNNVLTEAIGVKYRDAWDLLEGMESTGNSKEIFNIYSDKAFENINENTSVDNLRQISKDVLNKDIYKAKASNFEIGDIVGVYWDGSDHHEETLKSQTYNTHSGFVSDIVDGVPIITHNLEGSVRQQPYNQLRTAWIRRPNKDIILQSTYDSSAVEEVPDDLAFVENYKNRFPDAVLTNKREKEIQSIAKRATFNSINIPKILNSSVDPEWLKNTTIAITGVESGFGSGAQRTVQEARNLKGGLQGLAYDYKKIKDPEISLGISKVKFNSIDGFAKQYFNINSSKDLADDNKVLDITSYRLAKNYELFKNYAKQYPSLGFTETDIRNMAIISHNQGSNSIIKTGRVTEKDGKKDYRTPDQEIAELRSLYEGTINDVSSTNYRFLPGGKKIYNFALATGIKDEATPYIKKVNDYVNQLFPQPIADNQNKEFGLTTMAKGGEYGVFKNYISGDYDNTSREKGAEKIYDKLNRIHYKEAKAMNMSPSNYILTHIVG